jgi:hypothetical protein
VPLEHLILDNETEFPEAADRLVQVLTAKGLNPIANAKGEKIVQPGPEGHS